MASSYTGPITKIESLKELEQVLQEIRRLGLFGIDLLTTGSDPFSSRVRLVLLMLPDGGAYVADIFEIGDESLEQLTATAEDDRTIKVIHDAKPKLAFIRASQGRRLKFRGIFDTMLASQIAWAGYYSLAPSKSRKNPWKKRIPDSSLEALAERHLGILLDRSYQTFDWSASDLPSEQMEHASKRIQVLLPIYRILKKLISMNNLDKTADLEFRTLSPVVEMEA